MAAVHKIALQLIILQIYAAAAPSDPSRVEQTVGAQAVLPKLEPLSSTEENKAQNSSTRQKRFYNLYGYGFPPVNPVQYPTYNKRDQASELGIYGIDDPLSQIHRKLLEIASVARQPIPLPTPHAHIPLFFPVIFIPQFGCACGPENVTLKPSPQPLPPTQNPNEGTTPDVENRLPVMDDERQNWGLVVEDEQNEDNGEDYSRPISFDPISLNSTLQRPAPPVEHGSSQSGMPEGNQPSTTIRPNVPSINPISSSPPVGSLPGIARPLDPPREAPSACDGAVLSCCHQPQVTYDCFSVLGCPDPTSYGNPCDSLVILRVIDKFQKFYGPRAG